MHDDLTFNAGDDWVIDGALTAEDGSPLDQSAATYEWALLDSDGAVVPLAGVTIAPVEPLETSGRLKITVPDTATAGLAPGRYVDSLRVHDGAHQRSTLWLGRVLVSANVFAAA